MKKTVFILCAIMLSVSLMAQQKIQFRSTDKAECLKSDMKGLKASFSFSAIEAQDYQSERGTFSWLSMGNTVLGGNEGDPQIPVVNELIAVPFGANPRVEITGFSTTDYSLDELGIHTLVPRQPSLRKDLRPEDAPFVYNEAAYQSTRGLRNEPQAVVNVVGTMRGVRLGKMTIEPVSYDPVNNTLRVFNDIEVTVHFDGADAVTTEKMLVDTYSPYFNIVYKQLFNERALRDVYSQHPDLYTTPVKMLVVTTATYANNTAFQNWLTWKKQKGIDVDVQTVASGASANTVKNLIYSRYNANHPTFLVIVGDETVVTYYKMWDYNSTYGDAASDLEYASVDNDVYHDMFISRMPVSSTTELSNLVNKTLTYEKYTMSDPSYLSNVLLIAGADASWAPKVGRPTINYAADNYFNTAHGFSNVYKYVTNSYTGCYNYLSSGVGFANYTAHGDIQEWYSPNFTNNDVNGLTNNDKYFWAMGNCCLTSNFKNEQNNQTCFGEALVRAANKGAFGYIGSIPESYWYEDYYFGVGATSTFNQTPTQAQTSTGVYDAMFDDTGFNTLNAVPFIGNLAVSYAHSGNYQHSVSDEYYWRAYQCFGDGSVMPYHTQPAPNNVSHASTIGIGMDSFTVNAVAGSYVSITKNNEILGVAEVPSSGSVDVPITGLNSAGDVMVVVTRQQRQPYITTIQAVSNEGPYISLDGYTPNLAFVNENTDLSITFKNVGNEATSGTTTVTLTSTNPYVTIVTGTKTFGSLNANATTTVNGFCFRLNSGVTLGANVTLHFTAVNGSNSWEGNITITPNEVFMVTLSTNNPDYGTVSGGGQYNYGESCTITAIPADGYMFSNWTQNGTLVSSSAEYTFNVTGDMNLVANFAEGIMIGSGTTTSDLLPSYSYYTNSLTEQIYTSDELGGAGLITAIAFYNGGASKTLSYDFYMKATTKSSFTGKTDWIAVTAGDKVFSGTITVAADDWTTINFSTPFVYDGTSNVVLVVDKCTQWSNSPHMSCRVFSASDQALYIYSDTENFTPFAPPVSSSASNAVLSVKNQLIVSKQAIPSETVNITVSVNPSQAATVTGGGEYTYGEPCTVTATPSEGYTFTGWMENGTMVCSELSYSFSAIADRDLVATFIQAVEIGEGTTSHQYLPSYNYYKYTLSQQIYTAEEIGTAGTITSMAFFNEGAEKTRTYDFYLMHTTKSEFTSQTDWITVAATDKVFSGSVTMTANAWTFVNFSTPFEYDGISNLVLVADDNTGSYTSSPHMSCSAFNTSSNQAIYIYSDNMDYDPMTPPASSSYNSVLSVKNHILLGMQVEEPQTEIEQVVDLVVGWNWYSSYIELSDIDGLGQLENSIGVPNAIIQSQNDGYVKSGLRNGRVVWRGELTSVNNEEMYKIGTKVACSATIVGQATNPSDHPITINRGWNWIGFPCDHSVSVTEALSGFRPKNNDVIKGINSYATFSNGTWSGTLNTLEPGQGYMYGSGSRTPKTLIFQTGRGEVTEANITTENNFFQPTDDYADNMTLTAIIELDGEELRSEDYELAAFAGDECRGSVKLMYVESVNRYVAFLLVSGEAEETIHFALTDGSNMGNSDDYMTYVVDGIEGNPTEPIVLHFNSSSTSGDRVKVYPNPSKDVFNVEGDGIRRVEIVNAFGQVVYTQEVENNTVQIDLGNCANGVYMLRVVTEQGTKTQRIMKTR